MNKEKKFINSIYLHNKTRNISKKLKYESVTLQAYNNGITESVMEPGINFKEPFS